MSIRTLPYIKTALLILLVLMLAAGCAPEAQRGEKEGPKLLLGFAQLGSESSWRIGNTISIQSAAKKHGINLMYNNAQQSLEKQQMAIRSFISYQVNAIAFAPIVEYGWEDVLREAQKAGIPVLLVDREVDIKDESLYVSHIGSDFYKEGVMAGEYLLKKADVMGAKQLRIVEITGTEGSTPMLERSAGFYDVLADDDRFIMLDSMCGDFIISKGREVMRELLGRYGKTIDVLFAHNDDMMKGAVEAIEDAGLRPGKDVIVISFDADQQAINMLRDGRVNCVVECTPMIGELVMEIVEKLDKGEPVEREYCSEERSFTEFDDLSDLAPRGY